MCKCLTKFCCCGKKTSVSNISTSSIDTHTEVVWGEDMMTGEDDIDEYHRDIIVIFNGLCFFLDNESHDDIERLSKQFLTQIFACFRMEEERLRKTEHYHYHIKSHNEIIRVVSENLHNYYITKEIGCVETTLDKFKKKFLVHLKTEDKILRIYK